MKHFYMRAPDGVIARISDKDLDGYRLQGGFMKTGGPILMPIALGRPEANAIESLLSKSENFTFWFTPDYRIVLSTKEGRLWKLRFECRGLEKDGKVGIQTARMDGKLSKAKVIEAIAGVFQGSARELVPQGAGAPGTATETATEATP
jgi:hypothetical protein